MPLSVRMLAAFLSLALAAIPACGGTRTVGPAAGAGVDLSDPCAAAVDDFSGRRPAEPVELLGHWAMVSDPGAILELRPGGTGTIRGTPLTWSTDRGRLTVADPSGSDTNAWKVDGDRLVLAGPFGTEIVFTRAAAPRAAARPGRGEVGEATRIQDLIETLVQLPSLGPQQIERVTGARLVVDSEYPTWVRYTGNSASGPFEEVDLRAGRDGASALVVLRRPSAQVVGADLDLGRYGPQRSVEIGSPAAGSCSATFGYSGFRLSFSFTVDGERLLSVALERASPE